MTQAVMQSYRQVPNFVDAVQNASDHTATLTHNDEEFVVPAWGWLVVDANNFGFVVSKDDFNARFEPNTDYAPNTDFLAFASGTDALLQRLQNQARSAEENLSAITVELQEIKRRLLAVETHVAVPQETPDVAT